MEPRPFPQSPEMRKQSGSFPQDIAGFPHKKSQGIDGMAKKRDTLFEDRKHGGPINNAKMKQPPTQRDGGCNTTTKNPKKSEISGWAYYR
jgi:hypothetical protein